MAPVIDCTFAHSWEAEILSARPPILPARHFIYPRDAEEIERGALEVMVHPANEAPFLATCALGFADPAAPMGLWSCPNPAELCALAGGYAYVVDTHSPERFTHIRLRPVLQVLPVPEHALLLLAGSINVLGWGTNGEAWESPRLSWEGLRLDSIRDGALHGFGWDLLTDREVPFTLDLRSGDRVPPGTA